MFTKLKNIDTAFRHVRSFTIAIIAACTLITIFALYRSAAMVSRLQEKVYVLADGKVLQAFASLRRDNFPVEAKDHIRTFHEFFFSLDPDEKTITSNIGRALYLADGSARRVYNDLKESGFYSGIISGNISQEITVDSIHLTTEGQPFTFTCYAHQQIIRPTSIINRSLITAGQLRPIERSEHNPHGFLIERWHTLENRDINTKLRR